MMLRIWLQGNCHILSGREKQWFYGKVMQRRVILCHIPSGLKSDQIHTVFSMNKSRSVDEFCILKQIGKLRNVFTKHRLCLLLT